jgi:hypothetical protein
MKCLWNKFDRFDLIFNSIIIEVKMQIFCKVSYSTFIKLLITIISFYDN